MLFYHCARTLKIRQSLISLIKNKLSTVTARVPDYINLKNNWPPMEQDHFFTDMKVYNDFITEQEELELLNEVDPYMKRLRYEVNHWDDAIHGFRETERRHWYPKNKEIIEKISKIAFNGEIMPYIHILDLAPDGVIKPHVDSSRYCGSTIAGLSLLSDCIMRLVRTDEEKYKQTDDYRAVPTTNTSAFTKDVFFADVLLKRRSLYVMRDTARYNFTHEVLEKDLSIFKENPIDRSRRISIICRNKP